MRDAGAAELEADLRQLRRLARAGRAGDDHDLVVADGARDLVPCGADGQLRRVEMTGSGAGIAFDRNRARRRMFAERRDVAVPLVRDARSGRMGLWSDPALLALPGALELPAHIGGGLCEMFTALN